MSLKVTLAVGSDSSLPTNQNPAWRSAGYLVTSAGSIAEAIIHLRDGDFDLVLLGQSIPVESKERLTYLIRKSGYRVPIVCLADSSSVSYDLAGAPIDDEPNSVLRGIEALLTGQPQMPLSRTYKRRNGTRKSASNA